MTKLRILIALIVLALAAAVAYRIAARDEGNGRRAGDNALAVKTVPVVVRDFPRVLEVPGTLEAAHQVAIVPQVGGSVLQQHVQEGDTVRAGQRLFTLDAGPARARMAQSRAALTGARAEAVEAAKKLERLAPLMDSGYISRQEYDEAQVALEAARARTGTARGELEAAELDARYAQITAPIAGRVGRISMRPGDLVQAGGDPLTTLLAPGALDVRASVAQQDFPDVASARAAGRVPAEVFLDAATPVKASGELVFVDAQVDATTGGVPIKVRLASVPPGLLPGQGVRVRLELGIEADAKTVPDAALQHAQDGAYVYVVRRGQAAIQPVKPVRALDGVVMVEGGLAVGERVIVEIPQRLKAGSKVRIEGAGE